MSVLIRQRVKVAELWAETDSVHGSRSPDPVPRSRLRLRIHGSRPDQGLRGVGPLLCVSR